MASPYDSKHNAIRARIEYYAGIYNIPANVGIQQIWQESKFNPKACSGKNACGIAQFIPATAARFGVDRNNIESSLNGWGKYMRFMLDMFNGRMDIALAGYNSGENRAEYRNAAAQNRAINWSIMPSGVRSETKPYVNNILAAAGASSYQPTVQAQPTIQPTYIEPYTPAPVYTVEDTSINASVGDGFGSYWQYGLYAIFGLVVISYVRD